ncbi:hypothetical protein IFM89_019057 [Coptis chinensis]|uniref:Uncharacterized protein n=1 Tax=Coptis chinensis TaxID=261450 RepID=A0A835IYQ8_9MAGN|nr:hypothetical protein IFM89_019057 [Coptis chinensis]
MVSVMIHNDKPFVNPSLLFNILVRSSPRVLLFFLLMPMIAPSLGSGLLTLMTSGSAHILLATLKAKTEEEKKTAIGVSTGLELLEEAFEKIS